MLSMVGCQRTLRAQILQFFFVLQCRKTALTTYKKMESRGTRDRSIQFEEDDHWDPNLRYPRSNETKDILRSDNRNAGVKDDSKYPGSS